MPTSTSTRGQAARLSIGVGNMQAMSTPIASIQRRINVMSRCGVGGTFSMRRPG